MRYAIISDIHANRQAWESVLADITSCDVDTIVCLGDVVGYGPMPQVLLDQIRHWCAAVVIGNHDAAACGRMDASIFNDEARAVVEWTRGRIDDEGLRFLAGLPAAVEDDDVLFVHAETIYPERFDYITDAENAAANLGACNHRMVFVGHTHQQAVFVDQQGSVSEFAPKDFKIQDGCRYLVNVGSAGEPRDPDDLRGRYAIYDSGTGSVEFRAVDFDMKGYREDLDREGLPVVPYFLQVRESQAAAKRAPALPQQRAMRLMPISKAAEMGDVRSSQPSRLVVVPLPADVSGSSVTLPAIPDAARNRRRSQGAAVSSRKSHAVAIWSLIALTIVAMIAGSLFFKDRFADGDGDSDIDLALEPDAQGEERLLDPFAEPDIGAASDAAGSSPPPAAGNPGAAAPAQPDPPAPAPSPAAESRPLAAGLLTYLPLDANLAPLAGSLQPKPVKQGTPKLHNGRIGKGLLLDAKSSVTYGEAGDYSFGPDGFTISFWYLSPKPEPTHRIAVGNLPRDNSPGTGVQIAVSHQAALVVVSDGDDRVRLVKNLKPNKNSKSTWHHLALVVDLKVGKMRLHLDGGQPEVEYIGEFDLSQLTAGGLMIGTKKGTPPARQFAGRIDDLAIWHRVLSEADVNKIRAGGNAKPPRSIQEFLVGDTAEPKAGAKPVAQKKKK